MAKYRRKPVERDVVDALKTLISYIVQRGDSTEEVPLETFERDYEPLKREPRAKKKKSKPVIGVGNA